MKRRGYMKSGFMIAIAVLLSLLMFFDSSISVYATPHSSVSTTTGGYSYTCHSYYAQTTDDCGDRGSWESLIEKYARYFTTDAGASGHFGKNNAYYEGGSSLQWCPAIEGTFPAGTKLHFRLQIDCCGHEVGHTVNLRNGTKPSGANSSYSSVETHWTSSRKKKVNGVSQAIESKQDYNGSWAKPSPSCSGLNGSLSGNGWTDEINASSYTQYYLYAYTDYYYICNVTGRYVFEVSGKLGHCDHGGGAISFSSSSSDIILPPSYTLTVNENGGTRGQYTKTEISGTIYQVPNPSRTGYDFSGWTLNSGKTWTSSNHSYRFDAHGKVTANWTGKKYTNTLQYNGNKPATAISNVASVPGNQTATVTYPNTQSTFKLAGPPSLTGHKFVGWYTDSGNSGRIVGMNGANCTVGSNNNAGNQSRVVYAHWTALPYTNTLKYIGNKPSEAPTNVTSVPPNKSVTVTFPNTQSTIKLEGPPVLAGYKFEGWYTDAIGGTKVGMNGNNCTVGVVKNAGNQERTVYAQWTPKQYVNKLVYDANPDYPKGTNGTITKPAPASQSETVTYPYTTCDFEVSKDEPERKGYTFNGWWTTPDDSGEKVGSDITVGNINTADDQTMVIYAHWTANPYHILYDKNADNARLYGEPNPETVYFDGEINVSKSPHYADRNGWTFNGWARTNDATEVLVPKYFLKDDYDITLYAIYERNLKLILAEDLVTDSESERTPKSFDRKIMNHANIFSFSDTAVTTASTRTKGTYVASFMKNGNSYNIGQGNVEGTLNGSVIDVSTDLRDDDTILATRYFSGWSDIIQTTGAGVDRFTTMTDYDGTIVGKSGTSIDVTCYDTAADYQKYTITGDVASAIQDSDNNTVTIYPQYTRAYIKLPDAKRDSRPKDSNGNITVDENGSEPDKFIGWFTKPQPEDGGTGDGGDYYGGAGDIVRLDGDIILYPWFNIAPIIVHSELSDGFYEGQPVSYEQLMTLVNASDVDNPAPLTPEGYVRYDGSEAWINLYNLNAEVFLKNELKLSDSQIENIMSQLNVSNFVPELIEAKFYCDGLDCNGEPYSDSVERIQNQASIKSSGLDTSKTNVGKVDLLYQITDNGTYDGLIQILKANGYHIDSPITVQYVLSTDIKFNHLPVLNLESKYLYNTDDNINDSNVVSFVLNKQKANDKCDDITNTPWWASDENVNVANDNTKQKLNNTIKVVGVYDIKFNAAYETEHPDVCNAVKNITKLSDLWKVKDSDLATFKHIISYRIEFDCIDQWGKTASGLIYDENEPWDEEHGELGDNTGDSFRNDSNDQKKYAQTRDERSIIIIPFNNEDDIDLLNGNAVVSEKLRYIDMYNMNTLLSNQYWGSDGRNVLTETFERYLKSFDIDTHSSEGSVTNGNGRDITITVNDYTD